ncbi:2-deoxy-D-gluconate 3-dehydrogenase [Longispora fulva]|uniref:2-deoxy-D-gluconate 3-dehydrogenase n=2 Tax=Longispora fulva TaxID=619741 RepID=A0A8J7GBW4_9ACTN|nr:2-deoxy-D-gluconate 3-dehydrogenase [Longispora fulva]
MMFDLAGRTALVTGARGGIGRATALALADAGADLVLWGRGPGAVDDVAALVAERGRAVSVVCADLDDAEVVREAAHRVLDRHTVDILVNNAGTIRRAPAAETTYADWRAVLDVNLDAVFLLCQLFGAPMRARGGGKIVNVASLLSFQGGVRVPAYAASKHGVAGLTKALANEWAGDAVNVNAIAPGYIGTANTAALRADPRREPEISTRIPAGRWGEPEDVAGAVVFLAAPASDYVHGHVLVVDGGWMAR